MPTTSQTAEVIIRFRQMGADSLAGPVKAAAAGIKRDFGAASLAMGGAAAGIAKGFQSAISMAGDFERQINVAASVTEATAAQQKQLADLAGKVGKETIYSAQEAAVAITELGKAGVAIPDILGGAADAAASLAAAAGDIDMPRAAEVISSAMNAFGISGDRAIDVADMLAGAANTSRASVDELAYGMAAAGAAAASFGAPLEELLATLAIMTDRGLGGSDAGTSIKTFFARLTPDTDKAASKMRELGIITEDGMNRFFDAQGNFAGLGNAGKVIFEAFADQSMEERDKALDKLFGSDAGRTARFLFMQQADEVAGVGKSWDEYVNAIKPAGQATKVATAYMKGMNGALERLQGSWDNAVRIVGEAFVPVITGAANALDGIVDRFTELPEPVQRAVSFITAGVGALLAVGSAVALVLAPAGSALAGLASAAASVLAPVAGVAAAVAGLFLAYKTDFMGFGGWVDEQIAKVREHLDPFLNALNTLKGYLSDVASGGKILTASFDAMPASMRPVAEAFGAVLDIAQGMIAAFQRGGLDAALAVLERRFHRIQGTFSQLGKNILANLDWKQILGNIGGAVWSYMTGELQVLGQIGRWVLDRLGEVDWGRVLRWFADRAGDIAGTFRDTIREKWTTVVGPWLGGIKDRVINAVGSQANTLYTAGQETVEGLLKGAQEKWAKFRVWVTTIPVNVLVALGMPEDRAKLLVSAGEEFIRGLITGAVTKFQEMIDWVSGSKGGVSLPEQLKQYFTGMVAKLKDDFLAAGALPFQYLWDGMVAKWNEIVEWIGGLKLPGMPGSEDVTSGSNDPMGRGKNRNVPEEARALGGAVMGGMGRTVWVGDGGRPELVTLPSGSFVTPGGASAGRGDRGGGARPLNFYGNVTFLLQSADVAAEIEQQAFTASR